MSGYSILLLGFVVAGAVLLVCLIVREATAELRSKENLDRLLEIGNRVDDELAREGIRRAREWKAKARARVEAKIAAGDRGEVRRAPEPGAGPAAQTPEEEVLETYADVIKLLVQTDVPEGMEKEEFPIRAFARSNWKVRRPVANLLLLLRAHRETNRARRS